MTKKEFIDRVAETSQQPHTAVMAVSDAVFTAIADAMANGDSVYIPGFGAFTTKQQAQRNGKNPATGEDIVIPAKTKPVFRPAAALKDACNG